MRNTNSPWRKFGFHLLFLALFSVPHFASAGSISVQVSPNNISSLGSFDLTMTSSGMSSCVWSRLDNGSVWAWTNQPIPGGPNAVAYDSGTLSGWSGPATYKWYFSCSDSQGGVYTASALISIAAPIIAPPPPPLVVVNPPSGSVVNLGSWNVDMIPSGAVVACEYSRSSIAYGGFAPASLPVALFSTGVQNWAGPGTVTYTFRCVDALGQWSPSSSGTVTIGAPVIPSPPPAPTVTVNPPSGSVANLGSWNVDMTPNGTVTSCEYSRSSVAYGDFAATTISATPFSTGVQNWAGPGTVTYTFRCKDSFNQWSPYASGTVTIGAPASPTGSITGPSSCVVPSGGTSCTVSLSWVTNDPVDVTSYVYRDDSSVSVASGLSGGPNNFVTAYGLGTNTRIFKLIHNGIILDTHPVAANCGVGESWVSGVCTASGSGSGSSPVISVSPDPLLTFYAPVNESDIQSFTVTNTGDASSLLSGSVTVSGSSFTCFSGCSYSNLARGVPYTVKIKFAPTGTPGTRMGQATFSGGGGTTRYLNGTALSLAPTGMLDFDKVSVNKTKSLTLTVTNPSSLVSLGSGVFQTSAPFSCAAQCAYTLGPNSSHTFTLTFTPVTTGPVSGVGKLSGVPDSSFVLTGTGVLPSVKYLER